MTHDKNTPPAAPPVIQLLTNGRYSAMLSSAGGSSSRRGDIAVTRWRDDATRDACGTFCYVRDAASGQVWSTTFQPTLQRAEAYDIDFAPGRAKVSRKDGDVTIETVLAVAPGDDVELRRMRFRSDAPASRELTLTTCTEVVLGSAAGDADHPAFEKLFVQTEIDAATRTVLCTRRPQTPKDARAWMFQLLVTADSTPTFETDRARFVGRGRSARDPKALDDDAPLSGTTGAVLDPVIATRCALTLRAGATITVTLVTGVADTRDDCLALAARYRDAHAVDAAIEAAAAHARDALARAGTTAEDARLYARLASSMLYANGSLRADSSVLVRNRLGQSGLWSHAISGDLPIAFVSVSDVANIALAATLLKAHGHWQAHGVVSDLVIVDDGPAQGELHDRLSALVDQAGKGEEKKGQVFLLAGASVPEADRVLLQTVARIALSDRDGTLAEQLGDATDASTSAFVKSGAAPDTPATKDVVDVARAGADA